ncbi:hypothetical protein WA026_015809 [Henosepilachna vigintioctopunctata]|uniref:B box-type domain-containing protein n=1 Tax=Henosepilachna vigintioctopunctata TaxID=420089 RepID=A0AAW1UZH0_9CUCU
MKCSGCSLEGDKYVLFNCDCCGNTQCKECGDLTASEEKCFPLLKRKILLYCPECRKEAGNIELLMKKNRKFKQEINTLKENLETTQQKSCNESVVENSVVEDMKIYVKSLEEKLMNLQGDINRGENCKIENEIKLEQKNSENKKLLKDNDQLKKTIEKIEIENRNLQNEWDKLKEDKENFETVITTLREQITHLSGKIQRCSKLHIDNELEIKEYNLNFRNDKQTEIVTTEQVNRMLENLQICFEKKLDIKIQKITENFDNKIANLKTQKHNSFKQVAFREDAKKSNTINGNPEISNQNIILDQKKLMEDIINLDKKTNLDPIYPLSKQTYAESVTNHTETKDQVTKQLSTRNEKRITLAQPKIVRKRQRVFTTINYKKNAILKL